MQIRLFLSVLSFLLFPVLLYAQNGGNTGAQVKMEVTNMDTVTPDTLNMPPLGFYERTTIPEKIRPVPYTYVREADVLWSKIIWRMIDLRQKINLPLYYPTVRMRDRKSLTQALYDAIMNKEIYAYDPLPGLTSPGDEFVKRMTLKEVRDNMSTASEELEQTDMNTGQVRKIVVQGELRWKDVKQIIVKEEWFFDSKRSVLEVRVLGLCPVVEEFQFGTQSDFKRVPTFWVYYPEARSVLTHTAVYNNRNDAQATSFDDLIFKRRFDSYIIRETNEYNNRTISDYKKGGIPNMLESERIHYDIFNTEHDLWEF
jgi:gliding motility-associated protein GldN